jgi:glycosyltransferase involved in cell wall biosynthesis
MRNNRVLIIVENLPVPFDRRVWLEATTLQQAGYEVSVICPTGKGFERRRETIDGVRIYRHPLPLEASGALGYLAEYGAALFWEFVLALEIACTGGFDVIHACNPPDLIFLIGRFFKLFGKRFIFDHHDLSPEVYESKFERRDGFYRLLQRLERWTFETADVVISTNQSYRQVAIDRGGINPDKVFVVRSGPNIVKWPSSPPNDEVWRKGRKHLVSYVGVMGEQEGLDLLLQSVRYMVHDLQRTDCQFVLVGDGSYRRTIQALATTLDIEDYVTFTGRIPDVELLSAVGSADVCVNPDKFSELNDKSTMNKIIEYMALSKPIVQFDLKEGRFSAQEASLYARIGDTRDFADKIIALLDDPEARARMGAVGRCRVEAELAWSHQVPTLLAAYKTALAPR